MTPASLALAIGNQETSTGPRPTVLHVLEATLGGTLRYMENVVESLSPTDYRLGFAYGTSRADSRLSPLLSRMREQKWSTFEVPMVREVSPAGDWRALWSLVHVIRNFQPGILHCHSSKAGVLGRMAAKLVRPTPRVIYSPHALAIALGKRYLYAERIMKYMTDLFLAVSESEAAQIVDQCLVPPHKVNVAHPLIDREIFRPDPQARLKASHRDERIVLGIGRLTAQKDPLAFIKIVSKLQDTTPNLRGVWVGDGELRAAFYDAISRTRLPESFQLVPWQHDIRPYLDCADVLLSTSTYESFGYMVAEALAMQVPVVATRVTGTCDIMSGSLATKMFERGDQQAAVALLREVLCDREASREWAMAAEAIVAARFSRDSMRSALRNAYASASQRGYAMAGHAHEAT